MRVTKFYVGFPPAVVKRTFGATEYGIGAIPLGGFVRIVGMGRPRGKDLHACERGRREGRRAAAGRPPDLLTPALERARSGTRLRRSGRHGGRDRACSRAALEADVELIDDERVGWCRKELERVAEDADPRAYWRQATWRAHHGDRGRPGREPDRGVRRADGLLRRTASPSTCRRPPCKQVQVSSPAQRMGLRPGDVVLGIQGKPRDGRRRRSARRSRRRRP